MSVDVTSLLSRAVLPFSSYISTLAPCLRSCLTLSVSPDSAAWISIASRAGWLTAGMGVGIVCGVFVIDGSCDWFTIGTRVEVGIAGLATSGMAVGGTLLLASHSEHIINKETALGVIVTNVRPLLFLTKIRVCFLRDHGHRLLSLPIHP